MSFYHSCLKEGEGGSEQGDLSSVIKKKIPNAEGLRVFLAGNPDMVNQLQRQLFIAGAEMHSIYIDPFVHSQ